MARLTSAGPTVILLILVQLACVRGVRVAVIGSGISGSAFSYFLKQEMK